MSLLIDLIYLFLAGLLGTVLYPLWINFVYRFQMGEEIRGDGPKTHEIKRGTPTMGGLVFVLVVAVVTFAFNISRTQTVLPLFIALLAGLLGLLEDFTKVYRKSGLPGFFEYHFGRFMKKKKKKNDIASTEKKVAFGPWGVFKEFWRVVGSSAESGMSTHSKFLVQALMGGFISYWAYFKLGWDYIWLPLAGNIHVGLLYPIITFCLFIVVLNSVALSDGLDGLVGGLSLFTFIAFWLLSRFLQYNSLAGFCATFVGALIPFLYFNVYPARIFMGNVGSHVLGAVIAVLSIVLHREIAMVVICGVMLVDGLTSPLQQWSVKLTGKRIFLMAPFHHHFELLGWPEAKVTFRFWLFGILCALLGIFIALL